MALKVSFDVGSLGAAGVQIKVRTDVIRPGVAWSPVVATPTLSIKGALAACLTDEVEYFSKVSSLLYAWYRALDLNGVVAATLTKLRCMSKDDAACVHANHALLPLPAAAKPRLADVRYIYYYNLQGLYQLQSMQIHYSM